LREPSAIDPCANACSKSPDDGFARRREGAKGFRADLIVNDLVILELKAIERLAPVHPKQLLTYLRLMDKRLGLLINFGEARIGSGIKRLVNGLKQDSGEGAKTKKHDK
jgi:hypothetical protein